MKTLMHEGVRYVITPDAKMVPLVDYIRPGVEVTIGVVCAVMPRHLSDPEATGTPYPALAVVYRSDAARQPYVVVPIDELRPA